MNGTSTTRISLLDMLRDRSADDAAWEEFVRVYGPPVAEWCRERGLQHDDALDVAGCAPALLADIEAVCL